MVLKILEDNSFIIVDNSYEITIFKGFRKKTITIEDYLNNNYKGYYLIDLIDGKKYKRHFIIEDTTIDNIPIGSRIKYAQDIKIGDLVVGKDGLPKKVGEIHNGNDEMYEISVNGENYVVNGGHILALIDRDTGEHLEMPVNIYMYMNDEFKSHWVMEKA
jgi:hypothetical protein